MIRTKIVRSDSFPLSMQTNVATFGNLAFCQERSSSFASKAAVTTQSSSSVTLWDRIGPSNAVQLEGNSNGF